MAVAFVRDYEGAIESSATLTIPSADASGADVLYVGVTFRNNGGAITVSSVTHNGNALTAVSSQIESATSASSVRVYRLLSPSGTGSIVVTLSASSSGLQAGGSFFSGAHATTPEGTVVTGTSSGTSVTATTTGACTGDANGMFFDAITTRSEATTLAPGGTQTQRSAQASAGSVSHGTSTAPGAASDTLDWTFGGSFNFAHVVVPILPAAGGGGGFASDKLRIRSVQPSHRRVYI